MNSRHIWLKTNQREEGMEVGSKMSIWFNMKCWEQNGGISQIAHWNLQRSITTLNTCPYKSFEVFGFIEKILNTTKAGNLKKGKRKKNNVVYILLWNKKI
jgi:hypothetical protein